MALTTYLSRPYLCRYCTGGSRFAGIFLLGIFLQEVGTKVAVPSFKIELCTIFTREEERNKWQKVYIYILQWNVFKGEEWCGIECKCVKYRSLPCWNFDKRKNSSPQRILFSHENTRLALIVLRDVLRVVSHCVKYCRAVRCILHSFSFGCLASLFYACWLLFGTPTARNQVLNNMVAVPDDLTDWMVKPYWFLQIGSSWSIAKRSDSQL